MTDAHPVSEIWVSGPRLGNLKHWQELGANITDKNSEVFTRCDFVFLGIKPNMLIDVLKNISNTLSVEVKGPKMVISMLAGVTLEKVQKVGAS